jgi:hypothetical protein
MKAGLLMGLESPSSRAERIARLLAIWGRVPGLDEAVAKIDAVSTAGPRYAEACWRPGRGAGALWPGRGAPPRWRRSEGAGRLMLGFRRRVRIETERMTLRLPAHGRLARLGGSCARPLPRIPDPWEPVWAMTTCRAGPLPTASIGRSAPRPRAPRCP